MKVSQEGDEKYHTLFECNPQPMWIYDLETLSFLEVNEAAIYHYGYSREEFLSMTLKDIRPKEDIEELLKDIEKTRKIFNPAGEWRHLKKNGELIYVTIVSHTITFKNRKARHVMANDITSRKMAEEALRTSEQRYHDLFNQTNEGLLMMTLDGQLSELNQAFANMHGYTLDELKNYDIRKLDVLEEKTPNDRDDQICRILSGEVIRVEVEHYHKDGHIFPLTVTTSLVNISGQKFFLAFHQDISERKQVEAKVRKKDLEFRKLSANVPDLIFQFTRKPDGTYFVPIASEGIRNIFGCSPEEVLDDFGPIGRVIYPEDAERVIHDIEYSAEHLTYFTCEFRVQIPGREIQWIYSNSTPERLSDGSVTWYGFNVDITERKQIELELQKAKVKAEESDRLKSAFLANMSHEIRTPMNGILGFSELLKEPGLSSETQSEYINIIEKSGARMLNIISEIMDISKIESGQMEIYFQETNVNERLKDAYILLKPEADSKKIDFSFKSNLPDDKAITLTDLDKLYSILTNLVKNAIKYTDKGSIVFGCELKDETFAFFVKDTGIGIPKDRQVAIFERFIQADIQDIQARQGAGLGLSIAKAFVKMLGGRIWVESEVGVGSTFYFTLPNRTASSKQVLEESTGSNPNPGIANSPFVPRLKILIAEDDATSTMLLSILTKDISGEVLKVTNGLKAVEIGRNNPDIDLILMDINMPVMGGYEATRQIRQFNQEVVIIAQTAYGLVGDREKSIQAGCNEHISKPVKSEDFKALISKYFNKNP